MGIVRQIRNVTGGYSSSQVKVRDATANDDSPPPVSLMQEIADLTFDDHEILLIMDMIDKRLNDRGKHWRHVLKALVLLDYLLHNGSDKVVLWCRENLYIIKTLREFHHRDDSGRDVGGRIRAGSRAITALVMDQERLDRERSNGRRGRRPRRYRRDADDEDANPRLPNRGRRDTEDDDLQRAIEASKETAQQEEERRKMMGRSASQEDLQKAMSLSQQNEAELGTGYPSWSYTGTMDPYGQQLQFQQQAQLQQQLEQQQAAQNAALAQAQQEYLAAQAQAQQEAQRLAELQQAQAQQLAAQQAYEQQMLQQQQTASQQSLQPLKTGSNNPFAAFNNSQQTSPSQSPSQQSLGRRPSLHRQSTFDKDHMDRLDQILSLNAPMDTFGNTGSAMIPAQHTENVGFVNSSGHGLTAMLTAREQQQKASNNPFAGAQYTGIATTQMQPAHTGYGFGNANSQSSTNLIDL